MAMPLMVGTVTLVRAAAAAFLTLQGCRRFAWDGICLAS